MAYDEFISAIKQTKPVVIVTHPRSGTHLLIDFLRNNFPDCSSWKYPFETKGSLYLNIDTLLTEKKASSIRRATRILARSRVPILKTHALSPDFSDLSFFTETRLALSPVLGRALLDNCRFIYVYRHPAKVMASLYHMLAGHSKIIATTPISDFIASESRAGFTRIDHWASHVTSWKKHSGIISFDYEQIISSPDAVAATISTTFSLEHVPSPKLPPVVSRRRARLARIFEFRPRSTAILGSASIKKPHHSELTESRELHTLLMPYHAILDDLGFSSLIRG